MPQAGNHEFKLGLPIFLEDKTGRLTGSDFVDLYSRCRISYQRMLEDSDNMRIKYGVSRYESSRNGPTIILEFGDDNSLGTIKVRESDPIPMDEYLPKVSASARCNFFLLIQWSLANSYKFEEPPFPCLQRSAISVEVPSWYWSRVGCKRFIYSSGQRWPNPWDSAPIAKEKSSHITVWSFTESLHTSIPLDACSPSKKTILVYPVVMNIISMGLAETNFSGIEFLATCMIMRHIAEHNLWWSVKSLTLISWWFVIGYLR